MHTARLQQQTRFPRDWNPPALGFIADSPRQRRERKSEREKEREGGGCWKDRWQSLDILPERTGMHLHTEEPLVYPPPFSLHSPGEEVFVLLVHPSSYKRLVKQVQDVPDRRNIGPHPIRWDFQFCCEWVSTPIYTGLRDMAVTQIYTVSFLHILQNQT